MLRRTQTVVLDRDDEAQETRRADVEAQAIPKVEQQGLDVLRAEVQRKFAAKFDLGDPEPVPPPPPPVEERFVVPKVERRRIETLRAEVQQKATAKVERRSLGAFSSGFRGRWRMTPSRIALVLVALLAGGTAAVLATQHDQASPQPITQPVTAAVHEEARTRILVAKQAIGIGQRLTPDTVAWEDWSQGAVRPEYVTNTSAPQAATDMASSLARFEFFPGEPIRKDKLAQPSDGYLSAVLDSGMRGVSVSVSPEAASGGFIVPNDHVDVVMTRTSSGPAISQTILHNVRVLAINSRLGETGTTGAPAADSADPHAQVFKDQAIATLELDPTAAEVVINATALGKLSLELVSLVDYGKAGLPEQRPSNAAILISSPFWSNDASAKVAR
ncbi:MAG: Flp pilus assembly protein CpaB [Devosia sp.]|nr:Flp pilus assembly protein CpaB [Devosia sp.]